METFSSDTAADCQSAAADSTTTPAPAASSEHSNVGAQQQCAEASQQQQVSSTTAVAAITTTTTAEGSAATVKGGSPPSATSNNNNNKIKSQQQQQYHQFRAPQQFVRHRRAAAATLTKKNKTWNKRQNKTAKQQQQHNLASLAAAAAAGAGVLIVGGGAGGPGSGSAGGGGGLSGGANLATTKADLENIQNFKNQLGGHHYYSHHGHRGGNGGGADGRTAGNGLPPASLAGLEKLGYGHGHLKQQLYKKMLAHRGGGGHHHHVLCAGAAHNTLGGIGGVGGGSAGGNISCCQVNGCSGQNGKDAAGNVGGGGGGGGGNNSISISSSAAQTLHYCCGRSKFFLPDKRLRKEIIIPPTKFLLGGNISDPLNLNSLQNETSNTSSNTTPATTPRQSPITTPPKVEVIIPPNIHDPLHLLDPVDSMEYEKQLTSPMKRGQRGGAHKHPHHKHRHRKNRKPKRRRYESYNSVSSTGGGPELDEHSTSSLGNSTVPTDVSTSLSISLLETSSSTVNNNNNSATQCSNNSTGGANVSAASGALAVTGGAGLEFPHEEREESLLDAPAYLRSVEERVERNRSPLLLSAAAAGAAANLSGELCSPLAAMAGAGATAAPSVVALCAGGGDALPLERASRDLRLELNSTTSSTCGSVLGGGGGGAATGRKRKISESNNSQKNKKFHRLDSMDKIVSPVVPQPGAWKRPPRLAASGSRKPSRRSTSISETEVLSPADELPRPLTFEAEMSRVETPDFNKLETNSEAGLGSPLSTTSVATSVAAGEQEPLAETSVGDNSIVTTVLGDDNSTAALAASLNAGSVALAAPAAAGGAIVELTKMPKFRADGIKYRYGNYDRYVGFRHLNEFMDVRLQVFQRHIELFQNKDILDIGCNAGHMTITVARSLAPKSILGIDIDRELIARARRNLSLYVRIPPVALKKEEPATGAAKCAEASGSVELKAAQDAATANKKSKKTRRKKRPACLLQQQQLQHHLRHHHHHLHYHQQQQKLHVPATELFPVSFPLTYGGVPCAPPGLDSHSPGGSTSTPGHASAGPKPKNDFPRNVFFRQTNYVLKDESQLGNDTQQYDLILCLSVTKWIHLNFGDAGLKLAFKRMFNQLRPGGKLILEAQNWASYKKKKNLTEEIYHNYRNIEFFPNKFHEYLLSSEVGFSHSYTLGVPRHLNKGFCRPIQLYAKGDYTPNHVRWSDAYYPQTPYEAYRGIYATMPPRPAGLISYAMSSTRSQAYDTPHYTGGTSGPYSCRQTPMYQPTSQYYNPLETDSYLPSYDMEYLNHMYVFASPLYQTVWSPPASLRNSSSHTPVFGSVRDAELDGDGSGGGGGGSYHRHVYPPNDDTSSPNANAGGAFSSIRDADTDDSNQLPASHVQHVYATNCGESSSSPQVHHHDSETIDESLMLDEELPVAVGAVSAVPSVCCDLADKDD